VVATRAAASGGEEKAGEVVAAVTSAADDVAPAAAATKKSGRSRYERRSSPHYNAAKSNREKEKVEKVEKDHKEKGEGGGGGGGGGSGIKVEKDHKEKEDKKKAVVEEKVEEESGKIASFLKPGKKRERSVRQKRLSERADHIAATNKGGNSD
jgi:hypothetical protein